MKKTIRIRLNCPNCGSSLGLEITKEELKRMVKTAGYHLRARTD